MNAVKDYYNSQILSLESSLIKIRRFYQWMYGMRLLTFIAFVTLLALYFQFHFDFLFLLFSLISLVLFLITVKIDLKYVSKEKFLSNKLQLNQNELKYLDHQYSFAATGDEFIQLNPHLATDFDLFGQGSLFQYLNRSSTRMGKNKLAEGLSHSQPDKEIIINKQEAIEELSEKIEFIQEFRTHGMFILERGDELPNLELWLNEASGKNKLLQLLSLIIPLINLVWIALIISEVFTIISYLLPFLLSSYILLINSKNINRAHARLGNSAKTFEMYTALIKLIESEKFDTFYLNGLKNNLFTEDFKASQSLTSLFKLLNKFDLRLNILVSFFLNALVLFDIQIYLQLENWKLKHHKIIFAWFDSLSEMDYLISLAIFAYNNKGSVSRPLIVGDEFTITAEETGHPLIHPLIRISNDISFKGKPLVLIITGANMAGKSTFLRTIAVNLILAMNGAPVCAKSFLFTPCDILSSIKIQDSLSNHESYFYAELLRLKDIINHVQTNPGTLVILDEILRGTNSMDKHQGSLGLLERLIKLNANVIIATHDLGIAELENKYPEVVINNCFEVELINDQLIFDYKLKKGVSQKLNASFLMKKMEIIH